MLWNGWCICEWRMILNIRRLLRMIMRTVLKRQALKNPSLGRLGPLLVNLEH